MIRIHNFNFVIWKFLQMSKLLYNTLKISGGENAPNAPPSGCAPDVIDYDYIESNHDYNRDYNCLETFSEKKTICVVSRKYNFRQRTIWMNAICETTKLQRLSTEKNKNHCWLRCLCRQQTSCVDRSLNQGGRLSWKKPTGHCGGPTSQHSEKKFKKWRWMRMWMAILKP